MIKQTTVPSNDPVIEDQPTEAASEPATKKQFIEPTVSVPTDVLEATTFFQAPTVETATS